MPHNKCVNTVRVAHSTRKPLRALLACYARRYTSPMRAVRLFTVLFTTALILSACQRISHVQYVAPATNLGEVLKEIREIALQSGFVAREPVSKVKGTVAYFSVESTRTSFTDLGVRKVEDKLVVDLILRTAGLQAKEYDEIKPKLEQLLRRAYGTQVEVITEQASMIPIAREDV